MCKARESVVVSAARTPFGKYGGSLKSLSATDLGGLTIREVLNRISLQGSEVDNVIMGMVLQAGAGQIPSRQATHKAGLPWEVPSDTINKVCISSLRSVTLADQIIRSGDMDIIVGGGMESMSNVPYGVPGVRWGQRMGDGELMDLMVYDGLTCAFYERHMGTHGSKVAKEYGISREEQDAWAYRSHKLAVDAMEEGKLDEETFPIEVPQRKGDTLLVRQDESPRRDTSLEKLSKLSPAFEKNGTITAGNAPGVTDGAAAMAVMSNDKAERLGLKPLARILGSSSISAEPSYIATVPGLAIKKLLDRKGMKVSDIDLFEVNEAFAAVTLTAGKILEWDDKKVNVNGGAVAFGHPIGASGARIIMTMIYELQRRGGGYGVAGICGGGAQGDAILIKVD